MFFFSVYRCLIKKKWADKVWDRHNNCLCCSSHHPWNIKKNSLVFSAVSCADLGPPEHGVRYGSNFTYLASISYKCLPGYYMRGSPTAQCKADSQWTSAKAECLGKCSLLFFCETEFVHRFFSAERVYSLWECIYTYTLLALRQRCNVNYIQTPALRVSFLLSEFLALNGS